MAIVTNKLVIGRSPKCASQYLGKIMRIIDPTCLLFDHYPKLDDINLPDRLNVFFVRHPLDWYASYYAYRQRHGWAFGNSANSGAELDNCYSETFDGFIDNCLKRPPYLTYLYDFLMAGRADNIGHVESIDQDLSRFLNIPKSKLPKIDRVNVSTNPPTWSDTYRSRLKVHESYIIDRWYS